MPFNHFPFTNHSPTIVPLLSSPPLTCIVNGREPQGLFDDPVPDMIKQLIIQRWSINNPEKSQNPPYDFKNKVRFADFDYEYNSTYHVMITQEEDTKFNNDFIGQGMIQLYDPVLIEMSARRLTYGKTFEELDNIRQEIVRILAEFEPDNINDVPFISGVQGIEIADPGDIAPMSQFVNKLPRSIWRAQVKCTVSYFINYF